MTRWRNGNWTGLMGLCSVTQFTMYTIGHKDERQDFFHNTLFQKIHMVSVLWTNIQENKIYIHILLTNMWVIIPSKNINNCICIEITAHTHICRGREIKCSNCIILFQQHRYQSERKYSHFWKLTLRWMN